MTYPDAHPVADTLRLATAGQARAGCLGPIAAARSNCSPAG
jgi:hypothetical protein